MGDIGRLPENLSGTATAAPLDEDGLPDHRVAALGRLALRRARNFGALRVVDARALLLLAAPCESTAD
jgi:hypothetical protein